MAHSKNTIYQWPKIPTGDEKEGAAWPQPVLPGGVQVKSRLYKWTICIQQHYQRMTGKHKQE